MYTYQNTLAREIKREVIAELWRQWYCVQLQRNPSSPRYRCRMLWSGRPVSADLNYEAVKDIIKKEVMAGIQGQQPGGSPQIPLPRGIFPGQDTRQILDACYQVIGQLKAEINKGLRTLQEVDPYREQEPRGATGLIKEIINKGQRRGFLGGLAAAVICHVLKPYYQDIKHYISLHSMEKGITMADQAISFAGGNSRASRKGRPTGIKDPPPGRRSLPGKKHRILSYILLVPGTGQLSPHWCQAPVATIILHLCVAELSLAPHRQFYTKVLSNPDGIIIDT